MEAARPYKEGGRGNEKCAIEKEIFKIYPTSLSDPMAATNDCDTPSQLKAYNSYHCKEKKKWDIRYL